MQCLVILRDLGQLTNYQVRTQRKGGLLPFKLEIIISKRYLQLNEYSCLSSDSTDVKKQKQNIARQPYWLRSGITFTKSTDFTSR